MGFWGGLNRKWVSVVCDLIAVLLLTKWRKTIKDDLSSNLTWEGMEGAFQRRGWYDSSCQDPKTSMVSHRLHEVHRTRIVTIILCGSG